MSESPEGRSDDEWESWLSARGPRLRAVCDQLRAGEIDEGTAFEALCAEGMHADSASAAVAMAVDRFYE